MSPGTGRLQIVALAAAALVTLAATGAWLFYRKGEAAGTATVTTQVQRETIRTLDAARISKERTDEEVRRTPYDDRADGLR